MGTANGGMVMRARGDATPIGAAYVTRRRVVDAPEKSSRRRSSGGVRGRSRDVSAGARPGSDLGKPRDVPARAAGPDHGDARARTQVATKSIFSSVMGDESVAVIRWTRVSE